MKSYVFFMFLSPIIISDGFFTKTTTSECGIVNPRFCYLFDAEQLIEIIGGSGEEGEQQEKKVEHLK